MRGSVCALFLSIAVSCLWGQTLKVRPAGPPNPPAAPVTPPVVPSIPLTLPAGTPLTIILDEEVRVRSVGQPVQGKTTEPIYAFDKLLVPAGSRVMGKIAHIDSLSKKVRTLAALNADFSPDRRLTIDFDELVLPGGRQLPLHTDVTPGSGGILQFVPAGDPPSEGKLPKARKPPRENWPKPARTSNARSRSSKIRFMLPTSCTA